MRLKFEFSIEDFRLLTTEIIRDCLALNPLNKVRIVHSAESIRMDGRGKFRNFERAPGVGALLLCRSGRAPGTISARYAARKYVTAGSGQSALGEASLVHHEALPHSNLAGES